MRNTIVLIIVVSIVFFLADKLGPWAWFHPYKWFILAYFGALSYLIHLLTSLGMRNNRENFINFYLSTIIIRFITTLIFLIAFLIKDIDKPFLFVGNFFALYLCFTVFEIYGLYSNLRRFS